MNDRFYYWRLIVIAGFLSTTSWIYAQEDVFDQASIALEEGRLDEAQRGYEQLISEGQVSTELYANLAKTYYLSEDKTTAILYYERALRLDPDNTEIINSLSNIRQELDIRLSDIPDFVVVSAYQSIVRFLSPATWISLQVLFGIVAVGLLYFLLFRVGEDRYRMVLIAAAVSTFLFILSWLMAVQSKGYIVAQDQAIVSIEATSLYTSPDALSPEVAALVGGIKVWITDELGEWYKVRLRDRDEGWVKKEEVTII